MRKFLQECYVILSEHVTLDASISKDWRAINVGHLISITPDVVLNKDLCEYMEYPPKRTMLSYAWFFIWIRLSVAITF